MLQQDPSARVLILSASGEQADVLDAVKAGATAVSYTHLTLPTILRV